MLISGVWVPMIFVVSSVTDGSSRADASGSGGTSSHNGDDTAVKHSGGYVVENSDSTDDGNVAGRRINNNSDGDGTHG